MKIILQEKNKYVLRFDRGEEVIKGLQDFCQNKGIKAGEITGLGAIQEVELSWYDVDAKQYSDKILQEKLEIISLLGNIAVMDDKIIIHVHSSFSNSQMQVQAGHVKSMIVAATCEIILQALDGKIERQYSSQIGLNLMQ